VRRRRQPVPPTVRANQTTGLDQPHRPGRTGLVPTLTRTRTLRVRRGLGGAEKRIEMEKAVSPRPPNYDAHHRRTARGLVPRRTVGRLTLKALYRGTHVRPLLERSHRWSRRTHSNSNWNVLRKFTRSTHRKFPRREKLIPRQPVLRGCQCLRSGFIRFFRDDGGRTRSHLSGGKASTSAVSTGWRVWGAGSEVSCFRPGSNHRTNGGTSLHFSHPVWSGFRSGGDSHGSPHQVRQTRTARPCRACQAFFTEASVSLPSRPAFVWGKITGRSQTTTAFAPLLEVTGIGAGRMSPLSWPQSRRGNLPRDLADPLVFIAGRGCTPPGRVRRPPPNGQPAVDRVSLMRAREAFQALPKKANPAPQHTANVETC